MLDSNLLRSDVNPPYCQLCHDSRVLRKVGSWQSERVTIDACLEHTLTREIGSLYTVRAHGIGSSFQLVYHRVPDRTVTR